ncbi:hypothetical protein KMZ32_18730 [Phycicoccus sp. MAQZ13P-2]|uniref:hypothetical protein n=1 Tax=Phycicoccus mangrovi TaxID=2840470 RepID=UPI001C00531F|nr:hypothetical protein [Phycicoccus mangrovi]MBT9276114.1 hypothetical protein [Phycicoccus mangrovi]
MDLDDLSKLGLSRDAATLVVSAASWMDDAMRAWASGDIAKVGLMAPVAVEHLGKAVLWHKNPVLLVQLDSSQETTLMALATAPSLAAKSLRTIGLKQVITRVEKVLGGAPLLLTKNRERMVNVRNGVTHVGAADVSRHVLVDALALAHTLLKHLDVAEQKFFGSHSSIVSELLDEKRSATGHIVLERRARAQQRVKDLRASLGPEAFEEAAAQLEMRRDELVAPDGLGHRVEVVDERCPVCSNEGRLFGSIEIEDQVDFDVEPVGRGEYEAVPTPYWEILFSPLAFECAVCRLAFRNPDELREAAMSTSIYPVNPLDLGDDFDLDELIANETASYEF